MILWVSVMYLTTEIIISSEILAGCENILHSIRLNSDLILQGK